MAIEVTSYQPGRFLEEVSDDVWKLLCEVDDTFVPPLSLRHSVAAPQLKTTVLSTETLWGGPVSYFESVISGELALACVDGTVAGLVSWTQDFNDEALPDKYNPSFRIATICTHPNFLRQGVATALLKATYERALASDNDFIVARYWNFGPGVAMLKRNGYKELVRMPDHRGAGIDTLYFGKSIDRVTVESNGNSRLTE